MVPDENSPSGWTAWQGPDPETDPDPEPDPEPEPETLASDIHAAYLRVTPERITHWCLDELSESERNDVIAFIVEAAPKDAMLHAAGGLIATRRVGFPARLDAGGGNRGRPKSDLRNLYIVTALYALGNRYEGGEHDRPIRYEAEYKRGKGDWCAFVAPVFGVSASTVWRIWDNLPATERGAVKKHR